MSYHDLYSISTTRTEAPLATTTSGVRDVGHLGDFTATPRMLLITALALPIGALGALAAWALQRLIGLVTNLVFRQELSTALIAPGEHAAWGLVLLAPVAGGLVIGLMARFGSEKIRGHGMPETIESVLLGGSKVEPRVAVLKPISAAVSIGTGGPFGAEGPIIMTGGALGSLLAQLLHLTADERKSLLVAGSAAGMAATFNSPLAAILLAAELLLFEWRPRSLVPVAAAVCVATVLRQPLLGSGSIFASTGALSLHAVDDLLCVVAGLLAAGVAVLATTLVYASEDAFSRLPLHWMWWPAIGGVVIGVGGLFVPQALGVGYDVIDAELTGSIGLGLTVGILVVKTLIWSLSLGSGTSGGVLAPIFMIGGALGALEAHLFPPVGPGFWALVGLAGVLGGVMRSPFTGIVFAMELTGRWTALLPLTIAAMTAYAASVLLLRRSVLTEKIARRGYHLSREYDVDPLEIQFVGEVMSEDLTGLPARVARGPLVHPDLTLRQVAEVMAVHEVATLPVVDRADGTTVVGVVTVPDLLAARRRDHREARLRERPLDLRALTRVSLASSDRDPSD
jgi:H+/Cl- antiporter ClcA